MQAHRLTRVAQHDASGHEPEAHAHRPPGAHPAEPENARQRVVRDAHEKERGETEDLRVAVDLSVVDGDIAAGRDANEIDHPGRRAQGQGEEQGPDDEVRREEARSLRGRGGSGSDVLDGGLPHVAEEFLQWKPVDRGEPGERFVRAVFATAVAEAIALEDRPRRREAARELSDGHRRRHQIVGLARRVGGLEIADDLREVFALRGARVLERMHSAAAAVEPVGGQCRSDLRIPGEKVPYGERRIEWRGFTHRTENGTGSDAGP